MQDNTSAFYKRVGALGAATALAVSGAFIASPAIASPTGEPDATSTDAPVTTATEAPASESAVDEAVTGESPEEALSDEAEATEEAGTLPPGLAEALLRDLGMTVEEFEAAGELGQKAADALPELQATEGFVSVAIEDEKIVITGSGDALEALALKLDATLVAPAEEAEVTEAPADETTDAPSAEAAEAAKEPAAEEETAAPVSLPANHRQAIATLSADYIANVGVQGLQSVLWDGSSYVISVNQDLILGDSVLAKSLAEVTGTPAEALAKKYENVKVTHSSGTAAPLEDVANGQGYLIDLAGACSIGFNGYDSKGTPAVISAGHCNDDGNGKQATLSVPTEDPAAGGPGFVAGEDLGTFGFSQFGGAGHSPINLETGENFGTDIAVIDDINSDLNLLAEVTEWTNAEDLTETTTKVTGVGDPVVGAPVCKSGRTTGWTCGTVTAIDGIFTVQGHDYPGDPNDIRGVWGFASTTPGAPGDSGGSLISGTTAVGLVSAGGADENGDEVLLATSLTDGLGYLDGYSVAVFVDTPKLTSHEDKGTVLTDEAISGTTTGASVKLTRDGKTTDLDVVNGAWSFPAPSTVPEGGKLEFTVQAINGFNESKTVSYELTVKEAPLAAPAITNPAADAKIADSLTTITGTGAVDAKVSLELTGTDTREDADKANALAAVEETGTATVSADGTWEWKLDEALTYGEYSVTAVQDLAGKETSPAATSKFSVILENAVITSITEGDDFVEGENPTDISGTGTAGATIDVTIGENTLSATVGDNGDWKVTGFPVLAPGSYTVSAVQTLDGATSAPAAVTFTVTAVVIVPEAPAPVVPGPAPQPGDPTPTPTPTPAPDNNGDGLPDTGAAGMGLFAGAGALLTAGGISALLINRRRQLQDA